MKILVIGDSHGNLKEIKKIPLKNIDLILLTGDLGNANRVRKMSFANIERAKKGLSEIVYSSKKYKAAFMESYNSTMALVKYLSRYAPVYLIYGNVESSNSETRDLSKQIGIKLPFLTNSLKKMHSVRIINNKLVNFKGKVIGGLQYFIDPCWIREFKPSNFKEKLLGASQETKKVIKVLNKFKKLDILICHQPPYGILDQVKFNGAPKNWLGKHAGSKTILNYIKKSKPGYVFCGHIHEGKGMKKIGKTEVYNLGLCGYKIIDLSSN